MEHMNQYLSSSLNPCSSSGMNSEVVGFWLNFPVPLLVLAVTSGAPAVAFLTLASHAFVALAAPALQCVVAVSVSLECWRYCSGSLSAHAT